MGSLFNWFDVVLTILIMASAVAGLRNDWPSSTRRPSISVGAAQRAYARAFLNRHGMIAGRTVFVNPYRASKFDGWGLKNYVVLAKFLQERGVRVIMHEKGGPDEKLGFGGLNDEQEFAAMRCELRASGVAIAGRTDLRALLALIDACAMTVGEPSGPVWLAAALGCSTVGIAPKLECSLAIGTG